MHLIVLVDVSRSMLRNGRLANVQAALHELATGLGDDRLSLVSFSKQPQVLFEDAGTNKNEIASIHQGIDALHAQSSTNIAAGLHAAQSVAMDYAWVEGRDQRVVLITDGLGEIDDQSAEWVLRWSAKSENATAGLSIIDASTDAPPVEEGNVDEATKVRRQIVKRASRGWSVKDIHALLEESRSGRSQVVARRARLTVTFNHKSVAGYRLFGHEATMLNAPLEADLRAGETSFGMFEVLLLPKGEELAAEAKLTWLDPQTKRPQTTSRKITRKDFAKTFQAASPALQLGTLAVETAEMLRLSPYRDGFRYEGLHKLMESFQPAARENPSFAEFKSFLYVAERSQPRRSTSDPSASRQGQP
jgi:hypothetical protein